MAQRVGRIQFVSHLFPNAEETVKGVFVRELATALAPYAEVEVCAPVSYFPILRSRRGVSHRTESRGLRVSHPRYLAIPEQLYGHRWRPYARALRKIHESGRPAPSLLHAHWTYPDGYATWRFATTHGIPFVLTVHGHAAMGYFDTPSRARYFAGPLKAAARVIAVSEELKRELMRLHAIAPERIDVIHNGYDPEKFTVGSKLQARANLGLAQSGRIVVTIARLSEEKRLDLLIEAMATLEPDTQAFILGDGPLDGFLQTRIRESGMSGRVHLKGAIPHEELGAWLQAADVFCLCSQNEGCPVVVHEALACGRPVIATRVGAIPDVVCSEAYGLLVPPNDSLELAAALRAGLARIWDEEEIARYAATYTWDVIARQTAGVYKSVLSSAA